MFTLIVIDYCSMKETIDYIKDASKNILFEGKLEVVLVDNSNVASKDLILESGFSLYTSKNVDGYLVEIYENIEIKLVYVFANENLGYARGNNLGARISDVVFNNDYYLISNNDLKFTNKIMWYDIKEIFVRNPSIAIIGPKIIGLNGQPQSPHKKISVFKSLFMYFWVPNSYFNKKGDLDYTSESKICYRVMGCFMFVDAKSFAEVHGFDTNTFLYAEEMILSERLLSKYKHVYFYNDIEIIHGHPNKKNSKDTIIKLKKAMYKSCRYYFSEYRKTPKIILALSDMCFKFNIFLRKLL